MDGLWHGGGGRGEGARNDSVSRGIAIILLPRPPAQSLRNALLLEDWEHDLHPMQTPLQTNMTCWRIRDGFVGGWRGGLVMGYKDFDLQASALLSAWINKECTMQLVVCQNDPLQSNQPLCFNRQVSPATMHLVSFIASYGK